MVGPDGGTGRRAGLKIRFSQESGSSTLPLGTIDLQLVGEAPGFAALDDDRDDRTVHKAGSNQTPYTSVDMSKWVAYSLRPRMIKKLHTSHDVGLILASTTSLHFLIL